jgi:hypothetical protein
LRTLSFARLVRVVKSAVMAATNSSRENVPSPSVSQSRNSSSSSSSASGCWLDERGCCGVLVFVRVV